VRKEEGNKVAQENTFICIGCPLGCEVTLTINKKGDVVGFANNKCKEGEKYVLEEYRNPVRTLTATVLTQSSSQPLLAVRTNKPILKTMLVQSMTVLARARVKAPVKMGDVIVANLLDTGADVVASSNLSS
jgi:CxxC motif-containing protein